MQEISNNGDDDDKDNEEDEDKDKEQLSYCQTVGMLLCNVNYVLLNLALSGLYYVCTGITYWSTDYFINELKVDPATV